jgi:hypothetical protein
MKPIVIRHQSHSSLDGNFESLASFKDKNESLNASKIKSQNNVNPIHNIDGNVDLEDSFSTVFPPKEYIIFNQCSFIVNISSFTAIIVTIGLSICNYHNIYISCINILY